MGLLWADVAVTFDCASHFALSRRLHEMHFDLLAITEQSFDSGGLRCQVIHAAGHYMDFIETIYQVIPG